MPISIHAPLRERRLQEAYAEAGDKFQSTLPYGSDLNWRVRRKTHCYFNPRSLTGATLTGIRRRGYPRNFNPRSLTGATATSNILHLLLIFQSTLPYGSDHENKEPFHSYVDFNPRSLTGATLCRAGINSAFLFQSTLPYGSDRPASPASIST